MSGIRPNHFGPKGECQLSRRRVLKVGGLLLSLIGSPIMAQGTPSISVLKTADPDPVLTDSPPELTLVSASASSGLVTTAGNSVQWNGPLAAGESVTLSISASINTVPGGTVIANQAPLAYDADGNGTNEAAGLSDDPATAAAPDPTAFVAQLPLASIPTLDVWGLVLVTGLLALAGWRRLVERSR